MKKLAFLLLSTAMAVVLTAAPPNSNLTIQGTLILASNQGSNFDPALAPYSKQLKRLNFSSYQAIGRGQTRISLPGGGSMQLGKGFSVEIQAAPGAGNRVPLEIRWKEGNKTLIHTRGNLPLVLGGPGHGNGTLILVLDGRGR